MRPVQPEQRPVLVLAGPTAAGKTGVAMRLSEQLRCEIIGADARQIFRSMDIGTAKPTREDRARVSHHCIDIRDPHESYSAAEYSHDARQAITSIPLSSLPIIVGGSGLYITAAIDGLSTDGVATDPEVRDEIVREFDVYGRDAMYERLQELDPRAADRYADRNPRRIQRALEYIRMTGRPFSRSWDAPRDAANVDALYIGITQDREVLNAMIDARCDQMWQDGLIEETQRILDMGVDRKAQSLRTVGYYEALSVIDGRRTADEANEDLKKSTRQYAKRQRTWFRKDKRYTWISGSIETMTAQICAILDTKGWQSTFVDLHRSNQGRSE
ncbi:MAG: tRNA (adenosine(37)-N6)-dimethylallyltransferase MiaA [Ignavibacteria bacterium]|nr:tRNA (adenosine(37)-N6)-dimethylallyltransferase MiaA [Ignavibacteria bacterium]